MSTLNVSNFEFELIKKIRNTTDDKELAILHKALNVLKTGAIFTVIQFSDLPDASDNVGKLYFVKNDSILYFSYVGFSNVEYWVPITQISINTLWTWGNGASGRLGSGISGINKGSPGTVAGGGTTWCQISGGSDHSMAIKNDGTLWVWGCNVQGQLGDGTTLSRCSPGTVAGGGTNWRLLGGGYCHSIAIKCDGTLWTWGNNSNGVLGDGTTVDRCSPGTVAGGDTNWCNASGGLCHTAAIKTDGTLWTWGCNTCGILGDGTTVDRCSPGTTWGSATTWCRVSFASCQSVAIKTDGTLWTWGGNGQGRLGDGTATNRCSPGTIAGGGTNWCNFSGGGGFISAIKTDGTLWTWGFNNFGRIGDGTTVNRCSPGTVAGGGTTWCQVSSGNGHGAAIKTDGTVWTWGCNISCRLGDGTDVERCSPGTVAGGGTTWCLICNGTFHTLAITKETV